MGEPKGDSEVLQAGLPQASLARRRKTDQLVLGLLFLACARLALQVVMTPVFEGPDEPFHLGRALSFAQSLAGGWSDEELDPSITSAIEAHPCSPDLERAFGCSGFPGAGDGATDSGQRRGRATAEVWNYESHQPPLYYLGASGAIRLADVGVTPASGQTREQDLLVGRIFSLLLVLLGIVITYRGSFDARPAASIAIAGLALLLPGASESLIRFSNDAGVFLWSSCACVWLAREPLSRRWGFLIAATGPLIKLTAAPIVAVMAVQSWAKRDRRALAAVLVGGCLVVPIQLLRGYAYGGTVELNRPGVGAVLGVGDALAGLAKSIVVCIKTAFWLGNWSFFRPPRWLLLALALALVSLLLAYRPAEISRRNIAHLAGVAVAAMGVVAFSLGSRKLFGVWGGVGGWYLWGWAPWLFLALGQLLDRATNVRLWPRIAVFGAMVVIANAVWFLRSAELYGCALCILE